MVALIDTWGWEMVPDAALEFGDVVSLNVRGRSDIIQVVASYQIPLDLSGTMRVSGRSLVAGPVKGSTDGCLLLPRLPALPGRWGQPLRNSGRFGGKRPGRPRCGVTW